LKMVTNSPEHLIEQKYEAYQTFSVCPVCLKRITAVRVFLEDGLYLQKTCPEHGLFKTPVWRGSFDSLPVERERIPAPPDSPMTSVKRGCPFDCGLCPDHRQQPCCVLLEVTHRCDLVCPICFASAGKNTISADPDLAVIQGWYQLLLRAGGPFNIQLSGGEPCVRDDLPEIIALGKSMGFTFFQINTNGIRIGKDKKYLSSLKNAGLSTVYLQFDGFSENTYRTLRGKSLFNEKIAAIKNCQDLNIGVVLVPTIKPGVNDKEIGDIIRFALSYHPVVRGVHFQPISYFGRYPVAPGDEDRITLPEVISAIHDQTGGLIQKSWFTSSSGPNRFCSFNCNFVVMEDGSLKPIIKREKPSCCCEPQDAAKERVKSQAFVARNWIAPNIEASPPRSQNKPALGGWDSFLSRAKTHLFALSGMAFQDAWTLDIDRLRDCYIMVVSPDNRLIPFCAYNLTNSQGCSLYR